MVPQKTKQLTHWKEWSEREDSNLRPPVPQAGDQAAQICAECKFICTRYQVTPKNSSLDAQICAAVRITLVPQGFRKIEPYSARED
jgi:hypothetical protein